MNKVSGQDGPQPAVAPDRRAAARRHMRELDGGLNQLWKLGRNLIVGSRIR